MKLRAKLALLATPLLMGFTLNMTWPPNTEEDLAGYRLYHSTSSPVQTDNYAVRIKAGNEFVTYGTEQEGMHCFCLTAYDWSGNESECSEELCVTLDRVAPGKTTLEIE